MKLHLIDGTYELFRAHFAMPPLSAPDGRPVGAVRGLVQTLLLLLRQPDVTHVACAFDHVITSFRNDLFEGYKDGTGIPEELASQFSLAEDAVRALGIVVWPMVEFEADDALATAAVRWQNAEEIEQIVICSPDKDLCQVVFGDKVVCLDRRREIVLDEPAVIGKFGVAPPSIPDYLALVGDKADGIPGIPRWGSASAATILSSYGNIEDIPADPDQWNVKVRGAKALSQNLETMRPQALLYKKLAILRTNIPLAEELDDLQWNGLLTPGFHDFCHSLGFTRLAESNLPVANK